MGQNLRTLAIGAASLVVLGIGFSLYQGHQEARSSAARDAHYLASKSLKDKLAAIEKPATTPSSSPMLAKMTELSQERDALLKVGQTYSGTRAGFEAILNVADLEIEHGDAPGAVTHYEAAVKSALSPFDRDQVKLSLGFALEKTGKQDEAVKIWGQVADSALEPTLTAEALLGQARILQKQGKKADALKAVERAILVAPGSDMAQRGERLKATLTP